MSRDDFTKYLEICYITFLCGNGFGMLSSVPNQQFFSHVRALPWVDPNLGH